jgi:NADPH:quinone reductase-like Zn-dependent oxidoreductase
MTALLYHRYGPPEVLQFGEVEKPIPKKHEILIKIHATTVTSGDRRARSLSVPTCFKLLSRLFFGVRRPKQPILGTELAGEVEATGTQVNRFKVGDHVFAFPGAKMGCYAEYRCMPEDGAVALKPPNLSFEEAATLSFGGTTALHFLRKAHLQKGEKVLVNGASGGVGTATVQLASYFGAEVTGVCSGANAELVRSLGALHVIDYTKEDFTGNGQKYDVIVDTVGTAPYTRCKDSLMENGRLLLVITGLPGMLQIPWIQMTTRKKIIAGPAPEKPEDLRFLAELAKSGSFKPVIDRIYPFEEAVEAHRCVDTDRKRGNVVLRMRGSTLCGLF